MAACGDRTPPPPPPPGPASNTTVASADSIAAPLPSDSIYIGFFERTASALVPSYRLPMESDFRSYWGMYKRSRIFQTADHDGRVTAPFWTSGLFNPDEKLDYAYILIEQNTAKQTLFAILSDESGYHAIVLDDSLDSEMGLATQRPVELSYIEGDDDGPRPVFKMQREGIAFFMFESAASVFVWDIATNAFKRYWISD